MSYQGLGDNRSFTGMVEGALEVFKLCEIYEPEEDEVSDDAVYVGPHADLEGYANAASNLARLINSETGAHLFSDSMAMEAVCLLHTAAAKLRTAALFRAREVAGNL